MVQEVQMRDFEELGDSWCQLGGQTLPGSLLPGLVGPRRRGGTGTGNGGNQTGEKSISRETRVESPKSTVPSPVSRVQMTVVQRVYTKSRVQRRESSVECPEARVQR